MGKLSRFLTLGFLLGVIALRPAQAAPAAPTDGNATRTVAASAEQAPDAVLAKLSGLIHAGKYAEAQQTVAALLILYPDDQRLIKAKALLDKLPASPAPNKTAPSESRPARGGAFAQPLGGSTSGQYTGMEKVEHDSLIELANEAQQTTDPDEQAKVLQQFLDESGPFLQKHPKRDVVVADSRDGRHRPGGPAAGI
jgi:hypothetical protein